MTISTNRKPPTQHFTALYIYLAISIVVLISMIIISFLWNYFNERDQILLLAKKEALTNFNKDIALRYWATEHGGVYVPASAQTPPNPYLSHVQERDIITPSDRKLTLMNPAYMIRQVMEGYEKLYGVKGRITSLKYLNPKNAPDSWEQQALADFEKGVKEVFEITNISGKPHLRLIRPLITKEGCLKCHRHQGYQVVGDVRGGIGVSVPLSSYYEIEQEAIYRIIGYHVIFGFFGIFAIILIALQSKKRIIARKKAEEEVYKINSELEQRVKERTIELEKENTERKQAEELVRKSEKKFKDFIMSGTDGFAFYDSKLNLIDINAKGLESFPTGTDREMILGKNILDLNPNLTGTERYRKYLEVMKTGESLVMNEVFLGSAFGDRYITVKCFRVGDGLGFIFTDITESKQAEIQIKADLKEKETLLNEIHHRVKNNMSVISSLLKLQMNNLDNKIAKEALQDSQNRVESMAMVHETLYRSDTLSAIDLKTYLSELGRNVFKNYLISHTVKFKVVAENIMVSVKQASPVGLIVNELIANCLKYAFTDDREGEILLELKSNNETEVELTIADNGTGLPDSFDLKNADSLGLKLVKLLTENQLGGSIEMESKNGTKFTIKFNIES